MYRIIFKSLQQFYFQQSKTGNNSNTDKQMNKQIVVYPQNITLLVNIKRMNYSLMTLKINMSHEGT